MREDLFIITPKKCIYWILYACILFSAAYSLFGVSMFLPLEGKTLEELMPAAEKMAETIAKNAPIAVRACKKAINDGMQVDIDRAVAIEEGLFGSCFETADQKEGMGAFLEKRKHEPYQNK